MWERPPSFGGLRYPTTRSLEFSDLKEHDGMKGDRRSIKYTGARPFRALGQY